MFSVAEAQAESQHVWSAELSMFKLPLTNLLVHPEQATRLRKFMDTPNIHDILPLPQDGRNHIRLLRLLPSQSNVVTIACSLSLADINEQQEYTAISYVWGSADVQHGILINGSLFCVRDNLWQLLCQLSSEGFTGYLWIDAICIDQTRDDERTHQVGHMHKIYLKRDVIAWLGASTNGIMNAMTTVAPSGLGRQSPWEDWIAQDIEDIRELLSVEYWTRLWVLQEYTLAKKITLRAGSYTLQAEILTYIFTRCNCPSTMQVLRGRLHSCPAWETLRSRNVVWGHGAHVPRTSSSIQNWNASRSDLKCTDVRDRIYGTLALIDPEELKAYPVVADYTKTSGELLADLVRRQHTISKHKCPKYVRKFINPDPQGLDKAWARAMLYLGHPWSPAEEQWSFFDQISFILSLSEGEAEFEKAKMILISEEFLTPGRQLHEIERLQAEGSRDALTPVSYYTIIDRYTEIGAKSFLPPPEVDKL